MRGFWTDASCETVAIALFCFASQSLLVEVTSCFDEPSYLFHGKYSFTGTGNQKIEYTLVNLSIFSIVPANFSNVPFFEEENRLYD